MSKLTTIERFWKYTRKTDTCWEWIGAKTNDGYGVIGLGSNKTACAHRFAYELYKGPIPPGMQADHLCFNRGCANPDHIEIVTPSVNLHRKRGAARSNKSSGVRNVYRSGDGWMARFKLDGVTHYCGTFATVEEASGVAKAERLRLDVEKRQAALHANQAEPNGAGG